jgi:hypothetical protein
MTPADRRWKLSALLGLVHEEFLREKYLLDRYGEKIVVHLVGRNSDTEFWLGLSPDGREWILRTLDFDAHGDLRERVSRHPTIPAYLGHW